MRVRGVCCPNKNKNGIRLVDLTGFHASHDGDGVVVAVSIVVVVVVVVVVVDDVVVVKMILITFYLIGRYCGL